MFCQNCGKKIEDNARFCEHCGSKVDIEKEVQETANVTENTIEEAAPIPPKASKKGVKLVLIAVACIAVISLLGVLMMNLFSGGNGGNSLFYITENGELKFINPGAKEAVAIDFLGSDVYEVVQTEDGKSAFFINDKGGLYQVDIAKARKGNDYQPEKIASDVSYGLSLYEDKYLLFIKNDALYIFDGESDKKIKGDIGYYDISEGKILANDFDGRMYVFDIANLDQEIKIDNDVDEILYTNNGFEKIVYLKYGDYNDETGGSTDIYISDASGKKEKIASGAYNYLCDEEGNVYYTYAQQEMPKLDLVNDTYSATEDENVEYPSTSDFRIDTGSFWFYEYDEQAYEEAYEKYRQAQMRCNIRSSLENDVITLQSLYAYTDGKAVELSKSVYYCENIGNGVKISEFEKSAIVSMDELIEADENGEYYKDILNDKMQETLQQLICVDGKNLTNITDCDEIENLAYSYVTEDGLLILETYDDDYNSCLLYEGKQKDGKISVELIAEEAFSIDHNYNGGILYGVGDDVGSLSLFAYKNGKKTKIDDDVDMDSFIYLNDGSLLYISDLSKGVGTLNLYKNGKNIKIADDVKENSYINVGEELYFIVYDRTDDEAGELYQYKGEKKSPLLIESDVKNLW